MAIYDVNTVNLTRSGLAAYSGADAKLNYVMRRLDITKRVIRTAQVRSLFAIQLWTALNFLDTNIELDRLNREVDRALAAKLARDTEYNKLQAEAPAGTIVDPDDPRLPPYYLVQLPAETYERYNVWDGVLRYGATFNPDILREHKGVFPRIDPGSPRGIREEIETLALSGDALAIYAIDGYQEEHQKFVQYVKDRLGEVREEISVSEVELVNLTADPAIYDTTVVLDVTVAPVPEAFEALGILYPHGEIPEDIAESIQDELDKLFAESLPAYQREPYIDRVSSESILQGCPIDARLTFAQILIDLGYNREVRSTGENLNNQKPRTGDGIDDNNDGSFRLKERIVGLDLLLKTRPAPPPPVTPPPPPPVDPTELPPELPPFVDPPVEPPPVDPDLGELPPPDDPNIVTLRAETRCYTTKRNDGRPNFDGAYNTLAIGSRIRYITRQTFNKPGGGWELWWFVNPPSGDGFSSSQCYILINQQAGTPPVNQVRGDEVGRIKTRVDGLAKDLRDTIAFVNSPDYRRNLGLATGGLGGAVAGGLATIPFIAGATALGTAASGIAGGLALGAPLGVTIVGTVTGVVAAVSVSVPAVVGIAATAPFIIGGVVVGGVLGAATLGILGASTGATANRPPLDQATRLRLQAQVGALLNEYALIARRFGLEGDDDITLADLQASPAWQALNARNNPAAFDVVITLGNIRNTIIAANRALAR